MYIITLCMLYTLCILLLYVYYYFMYVINFMYIITLCMLYTLCILLLYVCCTLYLPNKNMLTISYEMHWC